MWLRGGTHMGGPQPAQPAAGKDPAGREELLILLASPPSAAERALVRQWLRDGGIQPAAVLPLNGPGLARSLDQAEPATVAALRGRWGGTGSFAQFVSRQARLALDRSERALLGYRYKVPKEVTEAVEDSPDFRAQVADQLGLTEHEAMERAEADLDSLVASMSPIAVDLLSGTLRPLHAHAWDVQADTAGL